MSVLEVMQQTRALIPDRNHWAVRYEMLPRDDGSVSYCLEGALCKAATGSLGFRFYQHNSNLRKAVDLVWKAIYQLYPENTHSRLSSFNDRGNWEQINKVLDKALELAVSYEEDEEIAAILAKADEQDAIAQEILFEEQLATLLSVNASSFE